MERYFPLFFGTNGTSRPTTFPLGGIDYDFRGFITIFVIDSVGGFTEFTVNVTVSQTFII